MVHMNQPAQTDCDRPSLIVQRFKTGGLGSENGPQMCSDCGKKKKNIPPQKTKTLHADLYIYIYIYIYI